MREQKTKKARCGEPGPTPVSTIIRNIPDVPDPMDLATVDPVRLHALVKPTVTYPLKAIPKPLWERIRTAAAAQGVSIKIWILWVLKNELDRDKKKGESRGPMY
jgi:hypothetical protein